MFKGVSDMVHFTRGTGLILKKRMRFSAGFTLVELLVVIAIISILAGMLLPVLEEAREKARQIDCLSDLKQIGVSTMMYANDHDGWLPLAMIQSTGHNAWILLTYPGLWAKMDLRLLDCASDTTRTPSVDFWEYAWRVYGDGYINQGVLWNKQIGWLNAGGGWAGYFVSVNGDGVYISAPPGNTGLNVVGGTKNAVVRTDEGSKLLYSEESTEVWFTDYGFGQLEDGVAVIAIDEGFAQTVNLAEPYHVFVQAYGDAEVYVSERTPTSFEVHLRDGDANVEFSYRIVAKRLGYEDDRLEPAPWADSDPNLYPEKQDALDAQQGGPQPVGGSE